MYQELLYTWTTRTKRKGLRYPNAGKHAKIGTPTGKVGFEVCFIRYHDDLYLRIDFQM